MPAHQQIKFSFNPLHTHHFGGTWERDVQFVKTALQVTLGTQVVSEEVLYTMLNEIELNSKPLCVFKYFRL